MKKNLRGSALIWAMITMFMMVIIVGAVLTVSMIYYKRTSSSSEKNQYYYNAKSGIELISGYLNEGNSTVLSKLVTNNSVGSTAALTVSLGSGEKCEVEGFRESDNVLILTSYSPDKSDEESRVCAKLSYFDGKWSIDGFITN